MGAKSEQSQEPAFAVPSAESRVTIRVGDALTVSGLVETPVEARAGCVIAHGAGAGMNHPFLVSLAAGLAKRGVVTLRYQFPYMERGSGRPDPPPLAQATVRAAVAEATRLWPALPLFAAGKSFGGRMSSQAQAAVALPGVRGLAFLGFPLHPPGKPSNERARHLSEVEVPMLFLQGTRDEFAQLNLLTSLVQRLGVLATLKLFADADHSFHVPARTGRTDAQVMAELLETMADWMLGVASKPGRGGG